jgi:hypothetical protein
VHKIKEEIICRACDTYGGEGKRVQRFAEKVEERNPLEIPRRRKEDNMKINLKEIRLRVWTGFIWLRYG